MKKFTALILLMITVSSLAGFPAQTTSARPIHNIQMTKKQTDKIVYTNDNKTYHRSNCKHMGFKTPIKTSVAKSKNYLPCKSCRP